MAFQRKGMMVAQIQLTKSVDAVPLTRDYMARWKRAHASADADQGADLGAALEADGVRRLKSVR